MERNVTQSWEDFLNPEITRGRLLAASIFIASFESLKDCIVDRIREFYCIGFDETGEIVSPKYRSDVLVRNRSPVYASLDWLKEKDVIDDGDIATFDLVKERRNTLAHELLSAVASSGLPSDFDQCFNRMVALLNQIEVWWIMNVEIPTNPNMDGQEIHEEGVIPGSVMVIKMLQDIALGDAEKSRFYYDEFRRMTKDG